MRILFLSLLFFTVVSVRSTSAQSALFNAGISLIPYTREVVLGGEEFVPGTSLSIVLDRNASEQDRFAATEMAAELQKQWGIRAQLTDAPSGQNDGLARRSIGKLCTDTPLFLKLGGHFCGSKPV
ncbi:MAG: hypothetical protein R6W31_17255, partial [Bacteroidales bacterium]